MIGSPFASAKYGCHGRAVSAIFSNQG